MRTTLLSGLVAGLLLAGCAELSQPRTATESTLLTATATVESVDQTTRQVRLRDDADGSTFTVTAGPEVRNLPQLAAGDQVQLDYYQSTTLAMAAPTDPALASDVVVGRAPEGALPGGLAATTTTMVVDLITYDSSSGLATFRTPDGLTRRTVVRPDMRRFAEGLSPGARVQVTMTDAVAVTITEAA
jgi:hypothetical protein